ncbi:MAG: DUF6146 family protein [Bacteroidales bacterium]|jgi:hypothetical protein|nr:hypothetical protein [Lentimicrobium sp.]
MKAMTLPLFVFLIGMSICSFAQKQPDAGAVIKDFTDTSLSDSIYYELIVFDVAFDNWMTTNSRPVWYYEKEYYEAKNRNYIISWNNLVKQNMFRPPFEYEIDYEPAIDYGIDLNWKLFWYFKYLEQKLGIKLI